jgi:CBS-domain-containing membrane protein
MQEETRPNLLRFLANWSRGKPLRVPTGALQTSEGKARIAADIMNRAVLTIIETASVQEAVEKMVTSGHKVLPVVNQQHQLRGTVGRSDLLKILVEG